MNKAGDLIKQMRLYCELTQSQLAEKVGVTKMRISQIEHSEDMSFNNFRLIADKMGFKLFALTNDGFELF